MMRPISSPRRPLIRARLTVGVAGLLVTVLAVLWIGLLIVTAVLGEE